MLRSRFLAACISLSAATGVLVGGPVFTHEAEATAAARGASKQVRRTASAPSHASAPNQAVPSAAAAPSDGTAPVATASSADERQKETLSSRRSRESGLRTRARRMDDPLGSARVGEPPKEGAPAKGTNEPGATAKGPSPEARSPESSSSPPSRAAEARSSAAKAPAEPPSSLKSTAEKFAPEAAPDGADSPRPSIDPSASVRRELSPPSTVTSGRPVAVSLEGPVFDGGDVPRAAAALDRMKAAFVRCASTEGALTKNEASIDLRFLVRAPGRAEGVDVDKTRGLSVDVVRCMTSVLARSYVGAPSDDPVGVAITVRVRRPEAANN
jgi:hypothetical protein